MLYWPDAPVTRGQMAPDFEDVAPSDSWFSYIQKLRGLGITSGCSSTSYCVEQPTTRGQMAAFLARAFLTARTN